MNTLYTYDYNLFNMFTSIIRKILDAWYIKFKNWVEAMKIFQQTEVQL